MVKIPLAFGLPGFKRSVLGYGLVSTIGILWRDNYLVIGKIWFVKNKRFKLLFV